MSFKDLGEKNTNTPSRQETPEEAAIRAKAAARHKAKEEKASKWEEQHRSGNKAPSQGGASRGEPTE